ADRCLAHALWLAVGIWKSEIGNELAEAAGVEPAHAMRGDLANRCHTIRRRLRRLAEGTGLEPASAEFAVVFRTTALPVRVPFRILITHPLTQVLLTICCDARI